VQYVAITWEDAFDGEIVRVGRFVIQQVFEMSLSAGQMISRAVGFDFLGCLGLPTREIVDGLPDLGRFSTFISGLIYDTQDQCPNHSATTPTRERKNINLSVWNSLPASVIGHD